MDYTNYSNIWGFIGEYLPNYHSRDDVLKSDILFRFIDGDEVIEEDRKWIKEEFGNDINAIKQECIRLDKIFVSEALDNFYEHLLLEKSLKFGSISK